MKLLTVAILIIGAFMGSVRAQGKVRAPELDGARGWLNTEKPLSIAGLKGKVVLLDFWTYGCINCIHIIPDLKKLEAKYGDSLVVIGVHSAKFTNEGDTDNIRNIVLRYGIEHPIANDSNYRIWNNYAVNAWPTQVVVDPAGYVIGHVAGEGNYDGLDELIGETIADFRKKGLLDEKPLKFALERAKVGAMPLAFPGKVLADAASDRLYIADSNHNRIVVTDLAGKLIDTIGNGQVGATNGDFSTASFNRPQGLALDGTKLYVADTENQLIRAIDLKAKTVATIAGTGRLSDFNGQPSPALKSGLRSPWDLALSGRDLYVAMAGSHQIWKLDLDSGVIGPFAGSRVEARIDGPLALAAFAQPSGIATNGKELYVADSESNIIRKINFASKRVATLAGGDLFEFGDEDGEGDDVRFQHPLGVVIYGNNLLIADTYNHKIRLLDPFDGKTTTFAGLGKPGQSDGKFGSFYEPGGLSIAGKKLYVADTNNHAIRVVDLGSKSVSTLKITGLKSPVIAIPDETVAPNSVEIAATAIELASGSKASVAINVALPKGYHLNTNAPNRYEVTSSDASLKIASANGKYNALPLVLPVETITDGAGELRVKLSVYYCREDDTGVCLIKTLNLKVPVKIAKGGAMKGEVTTSIAAPE